MTGCTAASGSVSGYLTTGQAARKMGVSDDTVRRKILDGKIEAQRYDGGHWRIPKAALIRYRTKGVIRRPPAK